MTATKDQARRRLRAALTTTQAIDKGELWPALERLQRAGAENSAALTAPTALRLIQRLDLQKLAKSTSSA
ncbi:hypothetical protein M2171_002605 [Bradyrhizobium japonicum USDA 38]|uniref:hypothetical protein n=1 Tax=Bradyrhizobium japonicum TaxID=375 RepID=UPI0003F8AE98|nr:hypothetical protein [Bradyrhizobium japonicum]MCS3893472.1 hypothetical protein [Bradyrhizobium japonicum USDA 38]MCS3945986.1 hypothetical protein [Bradyrhizobium japonicum]